MNYNAEVLKCLARGVVEKHKTTTFPAKQFYAIGGFIDEDIDISTHDVLLKTPA